MATTRSSSHWSVECRLRRIEGQAAGLRRMWEEDRSAEQMLDQIAALRGALSSAGVVIVHAETRQRLQATAATSDAAASEEDVLRLVDRLMRSR